MKIPYELALGWRYTRAGRATRRNGFISFISGVSMLGIALGVAALIIVLSVMNGFQKEVRDRMLGVLSHIEVFEGNGQAIPDLATTLSTIEARPEVLGAAPFVGAQALIARGEDMKGALVRGIDPALEPRVTDLAAELADTVLPSLEAGAAKAGRSRRDLTVIVPSFSAPGDTSDEIHALREMARMQVAFYGSTPNYGFIFDQVGFEGTTPRIRERQKAGDLAGMAACIPDELLDHFCVSGSWGEVADQLIARYRGTADRVVSYFAGGAWAQDPARLGAWGELAKAVQAA